MILPNLNLRLHLPNHLNTQENLLQAFENYFRIKAQEKIEPILEKEIQINWFRIQQCQVYEA